MPTAARLNASIGWAPLREPILIHDHRMRRNHLKGRDGDRINAVLAAAPLTSVMNTRLCKCPQLEMLRA
jgi:hypothetical protein